jgi:hypothetical protein
MNDAQATLVVCDAGPLIHLDELDCLDLLADFSRIVIPNETNRLKAESTRRVGTKVAGGRSVPKTTGKT